MSPRVVKKQAGSSKGEKIKQIYQTLTQKIKKYEDQNSMFKSNS